MTTVDTQATTDDYDFLPISALNDLLFCERRAVMHHREKVWVDCGYTLEGTIVHRKVHDEPTDEELGGKGRRVRGMWLRSERLKLIGVADLIEFRPNSLHLEITSTQTDKLLPLFPDVVSEGDSPIHQNGLGQFPGNLAGNQPAVRVPFPVEYKRGRRRRWDNDDVQLCAQALCLEEMLGISVPVGAIFHFKSRRRREVVFNDRLRSLTEHTSARLRELVFGDEMPPPIKKPRCRGCSLCELCLPDVIAQRESYNDYINQLYQISPEV